MHDHPLECVPIEAGELDALGVCFNAEVETLFQVLRQGLGTHRVEYAAGGPDRETTEQPARDAQPGHGQGTAEPGAAPCS